MKQSSVNNATCRVFFTVLFIFLIGEMYSQNLKSEKNDPSTTLQYDDYVYKKEIRTIELRSPDFELSQPVIGLNSGEVLQLSFDDLSYELQNYSYTFIHCDANWEPSSLMSSEFIDGFADNAINEYHYSTTTLQKYIHYNATFPTNSTRFTKSGNYILKVYQDNNPDDLVLTKRFMIYDNKISIAGNVSAASIIADKNYSQEIDFTIDHTGYEINNPYGDLQIFILQNNHWSGAKSGLKPVYVKDQQLVFDYDQENVFPGGNEFRNFDIKSIRYHSEHIAAIRTDSLENHVYLFADEKRAFKQYSSQQDINGNFVIKIQERPNNETDADYCYVSFFLKHDGGLPDGDLYIFGAFNGWKCTSENRMTFNPERMGYEGLLHLKQGYYNYEYVFKDDKQKIDETLIEGSHAITENDYTILVYHRFPGTFYDQLIAVKRLNSRNDH